MWSLKAWRRRRTLERNPVDPAHWAEVRRRLPILDGLEATTRLRSLGYASPILALTANATKEEREASLAAGCNDFLCKPIDSITLCESVAKWAAPKLQESI